MLRTVLIYRLKGVANDLQSPWIAESDRPLHSHSITRGILL
jgi:hypothetical protein